MDISTTNQLFCNFPELAALRLYTFNVILIKIFYQFSGDRNTVEINTLPRN